MERRPRSSAKGGGSRCGGRLRDRFMEAEAAENAADCGSKILPNIAVAVQSSNGCSSAWLQRMPLLDMLKKEWQRLCANHM
eukprot:1158890-Pelagomonas_calceolata.AAC.7